MGSLRGDNGGGQPPGGGGLPDLPPEWGTVIIPDDPSELAREAVQIRRDLRRFARRNRWRRRFHRPPIQQLRISRETPTLGLPILIMAVAVLATLTSLFALAWPGTGGRLSASPPRRSAGPVASTLPDLSLVGSSGERLPARDTLPAVFLVVDGCSCGDLITEVAVAVPATVSVIAVARSIPPLPGSLPAGRTVRAAADPQSLLRATYAGTPPAGGVLAILIKQDGGVVRVVTGVTTAATFQADLAKLA
jgi:hypothetical protein